MTLRVKHNNIWKAPSAVYVKRNGAWVVANEIHLKRNGSWVKNYSPTPPSLVLFDATTTANSTNTGGWTSFITGGTTGAVMSAGTNLALRGPYWSDAVAQTVNNINITGAKSVTISVSASGVTASYFYSSIAWPNLAGGFTGYSIGSPSKANFATETITIPITDGGIGKFRLYVTNSNGGYVYLNSVVFNF